MYTATCLCGVIHIEINQQIDQIYICHCKACQKAQGGAFVAVTTISTENFQIKFGLEYLAEYYSSLNKKRVFCLKCASPIYSARLDLPEVLRLRVGIIDQPLTAKIYSHAFIDEKAEWYEIHGDAQQFQKQVIDE
ncbi:GFA family protein [Acinetobacter shaoyimingii]|uniref:GFA family protein n=1 Tax=Acinetobacter shaoyimingii TaxID=2715164 RepID=A0A6G8RVC0_9GAMM|nr:GFA family protein [Acinetobacter shaoyimingii]QIO05831.1 GFA family protein [Acinetobacter shaoyimingii]